MRADAYTFDCVSHLHCPEFYQESFKYIAKSSFLCVTLFVVTSEWYSIFYYSFVVNPLAPVQETLCLLQNDTTAHNPSAVPQKAASMYYMVKLHIRSGKDLKSICFVSTSLASLTRFIIWPLCHSMCEMPCSMHEIIFRISFNQNLLCVIISLILKTLKGGSDSFHELKIQQ